MERPTAMMSRETFDVAQSLYEVQTKGFVVIGLFRQDQVGSYLDR